jgi:hypothetical protein
MTTREERFKSVVVRAGAIAAKRARAAEDARRAALSPSDLRTEAEAAWIPIRTALLAQVKEWDKALSATGYRVSVAVNASTGQVLESLSVQVTSPDGPAGYPLAFAPAVVIPGHIAYSGPKGSVINGLRGQLDLYGISTEALADIALGYLDERVR